MRTSNQTSAHITEDNEADPDQIEIAAIDSQNSTTSQPTNIPQLEEKKQQNYSRMRSSSIPALGPLLWHSVGTKSVFNQQNSEYQDHFMDFDQLRLSLNDALDNKPNSRSNFIECLEAQWEAYQSFAEKEAMRISKYPPQKFVMVHILKYNQFICINQRMLSAIIREYDSILLDNLYTIWEWKINWNPQKMLFGLMKKISNLFEEKRALMNDRIAMQKGRNEIAFDRKYIKFFVKRSNVLQVIGVIIQHLPIYVFGENNESERISGHIREVYFDNDEFKCYHERVGKEEGARAFRIRWYGDIEPIDQNFSVWMERKIHHKDSLGTGPSMKERFKLKSGKVCGFLNGTLKIPSSENNKDSELQKEIFEFVNQYKLSPRTRTVCDRISFQLSYNNELRISLDLNLRFFKESNDLLANNVWFTQLDQISANDVHDFPFDILEIKLAGAYTDNPPQWITDLMDSSLLIDCYKFSKYGQSVNEFYQSKLELIPLWIENIDILDKDYAQINAYETKMDGTVAKPETVGIYDTDKDKKDEKKKDFYKYWRCICCSGKRDKSRKTKPKPVNPKVHFSNERTFLQWFKAAIFIGTTGIAVTATVPGDASGLIMVACAMAILLWGIVVYYVRNWKLLTGQMEGLHDFWGPGILGMLLMIVFIYPLADPSVAAGFG